MLPHKAARLLKRDGQHGIGVARKRQQHLAADIQRAGRMGVDIADRTIACRRLIDRKRSGDQERQEKRGKSLGARLPATNQNHP